MCVCVCVRERESLECTGVASLYTRAIALSASDNSSMYSSDRQTNDSAPVKTHTISHIHVVVVSHWS